MSPTAQLIAAYVVLTAADSAIGVAPNCMIEETRKPDTRWPRTGLSSLLTHNPLQYSFRPAGTPGTPAGTLDLRGGIRVRCRARGGKLSHNRRRAG